MKKTLSLFVLLLISINAHAGLWESVTNLPGDIASSLLNGIKQMVVDFVTPLLDLARTFITANPNPENYQSYWQAIIVLISAFYLLMFFAVGFKFVMGSYDEAQRLEAKDWAKKSLLIVVLCNASLLLYTLLLQIGSGVALYLWNVSYEQMFQLQNLSVLNFFLLAFFTIAVLLALVTLFVRYILVLVGIMAFPVGLFLYFVPPLQSFGKIILNTLGIVVFLQFIDVIILVASSLLLTEFANVSQMQLLAPTMGFLLIAVGNILLLKFAVMKAANDSGSTVVITRVIKQLTPAPPNPQTTLGDFE